MAFLTVSYLAKASDVTGSFTSCFPQDPTGISIEYDGHAKLDLSWTRGTYADTTYVEYNDTFDPLWNIGDNALLYNDTGTSSFLDGLSMSQTVWFRFWSYNSTYGIYSSGVSMSGTTMSHNITVSPYPDSHDIIQSDDLMFNVAIAHRFGETMNVTWYKMINGSWIQMGDSMTNVGNGTYYKDASEWGYDLYDYEYEYRLYIISSGGDEIDMTIPFSIAVSQGWLAEHFAFILMMIVWVLLLFLGEWKDDPLYSAICGGLGIGVIPATFLAFGINPYTIGLGLAWAVLNFYILILSGMYLYDIIVNRKKLRK